LIPKKTHTRRGKGAMARELNQLVVLKKSTYVPLGKSAGNLTPKRRGGRNPLISRRSTK